MSEERGFDFFRFLPEQSSSLHTFSTTLEVYLFVLHNTIFYLHILFLNGCMHYACINMSLKRTMNELQMTSE